MSTRIVYAGRARLDWAVRHALADARHFGDTVSEIVNINGHTLDNALEV